MDNIMELSAYIGVETDIEALWQDITHYEGVVLGGANSKYTIKYKGDFYIGKAILNDCMSHAKGESGFDIRISK